MEIFGSRLLGWGRVRGIKEIDVGIGKQNRYKHDSITLGLRFKIA